MMAPVLEFLGLLWGSVVHRPYVYAFFACFLAFATRQLGWKRMFTFLAGTYFIAYFSEYSSTRNGFPFGYYTYIDDTRARELWISNVPFWDSLSFVFLSYFSFVLAGAVAGGLRFRTVPWIGGALMTLLDVVIDPLALRGEQWFLGKIYFYPHEGFYFGVTAANFAGWFFVGLASQWVFQKFLAWAPWCRDPWRETGEGFLRGAFGVYAGVFAFNLAITAWIGERPLLIASTITAVGTLCALGLVLARRERACLVS